jgi:hypothetical protein
MNNLKSIVLSIALGATALTTGCATITGGTTQEVTLKTQKSSADSANKEVDLAGADCILKNSRGTWEITSPGKVSVHRAKDDLNVVCTKDGESPASATFKSSFRKAALAGNIALVGVGAIVLQGIDSATGGSYEYPDELAVSFGLGKDGPLNIPADTTAPASPAAPASQSTQSTQPLSQNTTGSVNLQAAVVK